MSIKVEDLGEAGLKSVAKTCMSSKLIGGEEELFSEMCVKAMVKVRNKRGKHPVKNVHMVKAHGKSSLESKFFDGYVTRMSRVS